MVKPKRCKADFILVEFDDPQFSAGWSSPEERDLDDTVCVGVGIKLKETDEYLELCMAQGKYLSPCITNPEEDVKLNVFRIPKKCIHNIKELTFKRKRREMI